MFLFASGPTLESEGYLVTGGGSICSQLHTLLSINTRTYILLGLLTFQESGECLKTLAIYCVGSSPLCFRSFSRGVYFVFGPAGGGLLFPSEVFALWPDEGDRQKSRQVRVTFTLQSEPCVSVSVYVCVSLIPCTA